MAEGAGWRVALIEAALGKTDGRPPTRNPRPPSQTPRTPYIRHMPTAGHRMNRPEQLAATRDASIGIASSSPQDERRNAPERGEVGRRS
jgi:hypothetical protein